jgi:predicted amidophosphoribosyltransferase
MDDRCDRCDTTEGVVAGLCHDCTEPADCEDGGVCTECEQGTPHSSQTICDRCADEIRHEASL